MSSGGTGDLTLGRGPAEAPLLYALRTLEVVVGAGLRGPTSESANQRLRARYSAESSVLVLAAPWPPRALQATTAHDAGSTTSRTLRMCGREKNAPRLGIPCKPSSKQPRDAPWGRGGTVPAITLANLARLAHRHRPRRRCRGAGRRGRRNISLHALEVVRARLHRIRDVRTEGRGS